MVRRKLMGLLVCSLVVSLASLAWAGIPNMTNSTATTAAGVQVSVLSQPDGGGDPLSNAYTFGGGRTNATVTLQLMDSTPLPIFNYPFQDMWIEANTPLDANIPQVGMVRCPGGTVADANTDIGGYTTFSTAFFAGSCGGGLIINVNGSYLTQLPLDYLFNSSDLTGDLTVDISDVSSFATAYFGTYDYCADLFWDGNIDISDISLLAQGFFGGDCP